METQVVYTEEPAHHARRPMNAFLIFCKRHRSVVRDRYPNLENRAITKILGDWWYILDEDERISYTDLARDFKDAFFIANPNFQWYKLPAPPLRTLSSRPRDMKVKRKIKSKIPLQHEIELEKINNNSTKIDFNKKHNGVIFKIEPKTLSMFTPGKLADEAQMGGLSSLLTTKTETQTPNPYYSPTLFKFNAISTSNDYRSHNITTSASREDSIRELQNALSETTRVFEEDFDEQGRIYRYSNVTGERYPVPNDQCTNQDVIDQIVDKRFYKDEDYQRNWSDDEKNPRSDRSCKGKRYQEFMAVGGLITNKKNKRDYNEKLPEENYDMIDIGSSSGEKTYLTKDEETKSNISLCDIKNVIDEVEAMDQYRTMPDNNAYKPFMAADFDLEAKIKALPSLSLDKFLQKKRDKKRKKKTKNSKPKTAKPAHNNIINSVPRPAIDERRHMVENWREGVIGSQKRKPLKVRITRLEINSMVTNIDVNDAHKYSPEIKLATEAPYTLNVNQNMEMCMQTSHTDVTDGLLGLATLAEVAANTSKLRDMSIVDNMTAKANDGNASKV